MIDVKKATQSIGKLAMLKFFPMDKETRTEIVALICSMVRSNEEIDWLVRRVITLYGDWPGPREVRAVYCSRFIPMDGIEVYSDVYPSGIPRDPDIERAEKLLEEQERRKIGAGVGGDELLRNLLGAAIEGKKL